MIAIKNIDVTKSGKKLFTGFSWSIDTDENWIITGPNGSGKTLLLEILSGMAHVPTGEIHHDFICGDTWDDRYAQKKQKITYIPSHALHTFLMGYQDLYYQQRYYGIGDERMPLVKDVFGENVAGLNELDIPSSLSIGHLLDLEVTRLSNGQLKKLLLLRSFAKGIPKLLLLDYPFEGLDYESREDLCKFIDFIHTRHHVQVILADHHHHLPSCINRRLVLNQFRIEKSEIFSARSNAIGLKRSLPVNDRYSHDEEIIKIKDLQLKYGSHEVFKNFNWNVKKGERWAVLGRNGAGKTTLFSLIFADHPQAYAQEIYLFGKRRGTGESIWDIKRRINYLGPEQISYLSPKSISSSAREYVKNANRAAKSSHFDALIKYFDADMFIDKAVNALSSGELQLMMIIHCFLSEKELWLLDEPFQFLDDVKKKKVSHYLRTHLRKEVTLILITHYDHDVVEWTNRRIQL